MNKVAMVTGVTGQDGYYLSRLLLQKGYRVIGVKRRTSSPTDWRLQLLAREIDCSNLLLEDADITDYGSIARLLKKYKPDEFYNLAAQSFVSHSFKAPSLTMEITGRGAINCLEAVRQEASDCKFYQASSSEMFGNSAIKGRTKPLAGGGYEVILDENSPMVPRSPYGVAKLAAHNAVRNYREAYNMFAVGGILMNHESPLRGEEFVTRKITSGLAKVVASKERVVKLGNMDAQRDWGHAEDYMDAAWRMMNNSRPIDYVIATGQTYSIKQFAKLACLCANIQNWEEKFEIDESLIRPSEVDVLIGDPSRAKKELGWRPQHTFIDLVYGMTQFDLQLHDKQWVMRDKEAVKILAYNQCI